MTAATLGAVAPALATAAGTHRPEEAVALVTGAARGIGAAVAQALAADGWTVAVASRAGGPAAADVLEAVEELGVRAVSVTADICSPDAAERLVAGAEDALGAPVLALVNNAGITADGLALQLADDEWEAVLDTNLTAAFRLTRRVLRGMVRARYGRVVNIASVVGPRANAGQANYAAAKAGLIGLTATVAVEVARRGVTVNAVAPGFIATDMTAELPAAVLDRVPARRAGRPEEVAAVVRFLASDAAAYVTGTTVYVDGGLSA